MKIGIANSVWMYFCDGAFIYEEHLIRLTLEPYSMENNNKKEDHLLRILNTAAS